MECNRDEALRAKEIAEKKFAVKDIAGAKKFALKAQNLYPGLDGIAQMLAILEVHLSAEVSVNGEKDWYAILGVLASADDEMVKKQYRKFALMLHPDKNKSVGAEGAFKLISEAWSVLSDRSRRMAYDQKRNIKGYQQRAPQPTRDPSYPNVSNGFCNFGATSGARIRKSAARAAPSAVPPPAPPVKTNTFWTACNRCKMQYEYLRIYLNHNLLCPNCHEPFLAIETPIPTNGPNPSVPWTKQHQQNSKHNSASKNVYGPGKNTSGVPGMGPSGFQHGPNLDSYNNPNFQWGAFSRTAGAASAAASFSAAAQTVNVVHQTYEKVRRERKEAEAAAKREEALLRRNHVLHKSAGSDFAGNPHAGFSNNLPNRERASKKRRSVGDDGGNEYRGDETEGKTFTANANKSFNFHTQVYETAKTNGISGDPGKSRFSSRQANDLSRELSYLDIRNMLMQKAKIIVQKKLEDLSSAAAAAKVVVKEKSKKKQKQKESDREQENAELHGDVPNEKNLADSMNEQVPKKVVALSGPSVESEGEVKEPISIDVPDPDFHDFDKDRSEKSFEPDQVWATYDDEDGMPRLYVLVQKVVSLKPFKVRLSFLNSKTTNEFGQLNWVGSGFAKTCGDFRVGKYVIRDTVNIFSHRVRWEKGSRGVIRIVPQRGEIWALYRNWSPDWDEHTPDEVIYKYDMVEVLDDYTEEGVAVTPLVKVAGFKTVFHRHLDPKEVKRIPRTEMFRFSHQVPSYLLTGEEAQNAPKGCCELDPAATPVELLQVITDAKEEGMVETAEQ